MPPLYQTAMGKNAPEAGADCVLAVAVALLVFDCASATPAIRKSARPPAKMRFILPPWIDCRGVGSGKKCDALAAANKSFIRAEDVLIVVRR